MPAEQSAGRFRRALERHVCPFETLLLCDLLHRDVQACASARRSIVDLAGIGACVVDQLLECFPGRVIADHDAERVTADTNDVRKVGGRIEAGLAHERKAEDRYRYL